MCASLNAPRNAEPRWPDVPNATRCAGSAGSGRTSWYAASRASMSTRSAAVAGWPARGFDGAMGAVCRTALPQTPRIERPAPAQESDRDEHPEGREDEDRRRGDRGVQVPALELAVHDERQRLGPALD